jgi:protein SCO1/2
LPDDPLPDLGSSQGDRRARAGSARPVHHRRSGTGYAEALKSYVGSFDERIVGLTGDRPAIDEAIRTFRAFARRVPTKENDYTMEHTATVYLMDRRGAFVGSFSLSRPPEDAARDLLRLL